MKNVWLIFKTNMKRNRGVVFLSVFSGFILCLILYLLGSYAAGSALSKIKIGIVDYDDSPLSKNFKSYLGDELNCELVEGQNFDKLSKLLIDKDISFIIEIPAGFYDKFAAGEADKVYVTSSDDYENEAFTEAYINSYLDSIHMLSAACAGNKETFNLYLAEYENAGNSVYQENAYSLDLKMLKEKEGFRNTICFYLITAFVLAMTVSFIIADDRRRGIYNRITASTVKPAEYIAGNSIFGFFLLLTEAVIYCGYMTVMNINIGFPVYKLFLLLILFSLFVTCFVIDVSLIIRSKSGLTVIIFSFNTIGTLIGGAYFALELAPETLRNFARIMPQFWITDALYELMDNRAADIGPNVLILALFTLLAFLVGAVLFSQNYKRG